MHFEAYKTTLQAFRDQGFSSLDLANITLPELDALLDDQAHLIASLLEQGAVIAGWKIVDRNDGVIISPIFDFQVVPTTGETVSREVLRGTEMEVCFQLNVPTSNESISELVASLDTYAAIELIRPAINTLNHPACDFFFNYGVLISQKTLSGDLVFNGGHQEYEFTFSIEQAAERKRSVLKQGVLECIRRGYAGKNYFFITGTLNGLVSVADSIGFNSLTNHDETLISFNVL